MALMDGTASKVSPTEVTADAEVATSALAFVTEVANLTKDGEKLDNEGEPWSMSNDDAWETLHSLISEARGILRVPDPPQVG